MRKISLLVLALLTLGACGGEQSSSAENAAGENLFAPGQAPPDGLWKGDYIDFIFEGGVIQSIVVHGVSCSENDPINPFISLCSSEPVDGEFETGIEITNDLNMVTEKPEWRIRGELLSMRQVEGLFQPFSAEPQDFRSISGTFYLDASGCDCAGKINFVTHWVPPIEELATTGDTGLIVDDNGNVLAAPTPVADPPAETSDAQLAALNHVNMFREMVGVPLIAADRALQDAATDHCACYTLHKEEYGAMSPHDEDPTWDPPCYGGLGERIQEKGYTGGSGFAEVMAFMDDPILSVEAWMATVYHRLPLTAPSSKDMGYGHSPGCDTINVGYGGAGGEWEVLYPVDGQEDVDTAWSGNEGPQPPPPPGGYPSGPVITIQFGVGNFLVTEAELRGPDGTDEGVTLLTPENDPYLGGKAIAFYANAPLQTQTTYTATVRGERGGLPWEKTWSFTTGMGESNW